MSGADVRQHFLAEQLGRFHQLAEIFRARGLKRQIDDADADPFAALLQLRDYLVRPTEEIDRQNPVDIRWPSPLTSDVAQRPGYTRSRPRSSHSTAR
jgi:hypothetical protein